MAEKRNSNKRKTIGLALGSGGVRGFAHIGVIKALVKHQIPIDYIAGTSAGALIGGAYASGMAIETIEALVKGLAFKDYLHFFSDPSLGCGLFKGDKAMQYLKLVLGGQNIENLPVPFAAVATDLVSGKSEVFRQGDVAIAIRASFSLPFIFRPIEIDNKVLVDGGATMPVPVQAARDMGADVVIGVNLYHHKPTMPAKSITTLPLRGILTKSLNLLLHHLAEANVNQADVIVNIDTSNIGSLWETLKDESLIKTGYEEMSTKITQVKSLSGIE